MIKKIFIIFAASLFIVPSVSAQVATRSAQLTLTPSVTTVVPGQSFTLGVGFTSPVYSVIGMDVLLNFDPSLVTVVSVATGSSNLKQLIGPSTSSANLAFSLLGFDPTTQQLTTPTKGTYPNVAQITLQANKLGTLLINPVYTPGSTSDSNIVTLDLGTPLDIMATPSSQTLIHIAPCTLVGDLNFDGAVNVIDLVLIASKWNTNFPAYDLNSSGLVDITDLVLEVTHWGTSCS